MENEKYYDRIFTNKWYDSIQDYYNSPLLDDDIIFDYLYQGKRQPQNEEEEGWLKEAERIRKSGQGYDMSFG